MDTVTIAIEDARAMAVAAFRGVGVAELNAKSTADALIEAECDGQRGHGLTRVPSYCVQVEVGKVNPNAEPSITEVTPAAIRVDADRGFAYRAIGMAINDLLPRTKTNAIAAAAIHRSHHFGQAGAHAERMAERGLMALVFGNSPKAMAFWGGKAPMMGTNPIAFACPAPDGPPLVIDLALSVAARGKVIAADKNNQAIPPDWALDEDGRPTTDAAAALKGTMAPMGGAKGAALALMVEILAAGLTGGSFGWQASSFFSGEGEPPDMGHVLIAIDPERLSAGAYAERIAVLLAAIGDTDGARIPGTSRLANRARAQAEGLTIPKALHDEIVGLANAVAR